MRGNRQLTSDHLLLIASDRAGLRAFEVCLSEVCAFEICAFEICAFEIWALEIWALEICAF